MFSAAGTSAVTRSGRSSAGNTLIAPSTAAPPLMSVFIAIMPSAVFSDRPPESKVMPLPTSTTWQRGSADAYVTSISRGGRADPAPTARMPPKPSAASSRRPRTRTSRPARRPRTSACFASHFGDFSNDGVLASSRASVPAAAVATPASTADRGAATSATRTAMSVRTAGSGTRRRSKRYAPSSSPSTCARTAAGSLPQASAVPSADRRRARRRSALGTALAWGSDQAAVRAHVEGLLLGAYRFERRRVPEPAVLTDIAVLVADVAAPRSAVDAGVATAAAGTLARELANTPSLEKSPKWLAKQAEVLGLFRQPLRRLLQRRCVGQLAGQRASRRGRHAGVDRQPGRGHVGD